MCARKHRSEYGFKEESSDVCVSPRDASQKVAPQAHNFWPGFCFLDPEFFLTWILDSEKGEVPRYRHQGAEQFFLQLGEQIARFGSWEVLLEALGKSALCVEWVRKTDDLDEEQGN